MAVIRHRRKSKLENGMEEFIMLKVVTTGEDIEDRFNLHEPLKVVFNRALQAVGGGSNRDQFTLEFRDQPLELDKPIADDVRKFGWTNGTVLELVPRPEVI
jgi:hypothetical protein